MLGKVGRLRRRPMPDGTSLCAWLTPPLAAAPQVGYGTAAEAVAHSKPFVYIRRDFFNEQATRPSPPRLHPLTRHHHSPSIIPTAPPRFASPSSVCALSSRQPFLLKLLSDHGLAHELRRDEFYAGRWADKLEQARAELRPISPRSAQISSHHLPRSRPCSPPADLLPRSPPDLPRRTRRGSRRRPPRACSTSRPRRAAPTAAAARWSRACSSRRRAAAGRPPTRRRLASSAEAAQLGWDAPPPPPPPCLPPPVCCLGLLSSPQATSSLRHQCLRSQCLRSQCLCSQCPSFSSSRQHPAVAERPAQPRRLGLSDATRAPPLGKLGGARRW